MEKEFPVDPCHKASKFPAAHNRSCNVQGLHPLPREFRNLNSYWTGSVPAHGRLLELGVRSLPTQTFCIPVLPPAVGWAKWPDMALWWKLLPAPMSIPQQLASPNVNISFSPFKEATHSSTALYIHACSPDTVMELCNSGPGVLRSLAMHKTAVSGLMLFPSSQAACHWVIDLKNSSWPHIICPVKGLAGYWHSPHAVPAASSDRVGTPARHTAAHRAEPTQNQTQCQHHRSGLTGTLRCPLQSLGLFDRIRWNISWHLQVIHVRISCVNTWCQTTGTQTTALNFFTCLCSHLWNNNSD